MCSTERKPSRAARRDVLDRHVVLQVEPGPALPLHLPERRDPRLRVLRPRHLDRRRRDPELAQRRSRRRRPRRRARLASRTPPPPHPPPASPAPPPPPARTPRSPRARPAAPPRWQLRCTAGFHPPATARQSASMRCSRPPCATRTSRRPARPARPVTTPPAKPRHGPAGSVTPVAHVDERRDLDPRRRQVRRRPPAVVVRREHHGPPRRHRPAVQIRPHRPGQHHPRPVVPRKRHQPLDRARRQHRPLRDDPPEAPPRRPARLRHVLRHPLERPVGAAVVGPDHRRPRHHPHVRQRRQLRRHPRGPVGPRLPADLQPLGEEPPAGQEVLVRQDHPRARHAPRPAPPSAPPAPPRSPAGRRTRTPSRKRPGPAPPRVARAPPPAGSSARRAAPRTAPAT